MHLLWFNVTVPSNYCNNGTVIASWQDSLERIVRTCNGINLTICFIVNKKDYTTKVIDGVKYIPIYIDYNFLEKINKKLSWNIEIYKLCKTMINIVDNECPDIIHVFGTEWPFGHISKYTDIPVVIHIMGSVIPYMNALFPPSFSFKDIVKAQFICSPFQIVESIFQSIKNKTWIASEQDIWEHIRYYMGRTDWDKSLSRIMHANRIYFHVEEALRPSFTQGTYTWNGYNNSTIKLLTTGCSTFWKGPDMLLKVAKILNDRGVIFEWNVAGHMPKYMRIAVEKKLNTTFIKNHVKILGFTNSETLSSLLEETTIYVHTAYIENSPNSICEAQCIGVPIISTNVGGISTLVKHNEEGILVPANDPWQMADAIIELSKNKDLMKRFSMNNITRARYRHSDENIKQQLLSCYRTIVKGKV